MLKFRRIFNKESCAVIGMIHVGGLPGTPRYEGSTKKIIKDSLNDAFVYKECHVDGVLIENMHDIPYVRTKDLQPETTAIMTRVCAEVRKVLPENIACGVQILAGCNKEAIAVAKAADLQFIRAEGYVFSHIGDEGFIDANAGPLLRYRKQIDAEDILVFADIKKKHSSHALTSDVSITETVKAAEFFLSDGVILTGCATGDPADTKDLKDVKKVSTGPVLIGSGVTLDNVEDYLESDAIIIGTHFKEDADWKNPVNKETVKRFMDTVQTLENRVK